MQNPVPRIVHMHIPKTAGTSVNSAFFSLYEKDRICAARYEPGFKRVDAAAFDFFTGHIGFTCASGLDAHIVCLLRDPIDRFISVYYYWRQLYEKENRREWGPYTANALSLDEFAERFDEPSLIEEFYNRITWQVASSFHVAERRRLVGLDRGALLERARGNLRKCAVVGRIEDIPGFVRDCRDVLGIGLEIGQENVTRKRPRSSQVSLDTRRKITRWVELDLELYWSLVNGSA